MYFCNKCSSKFCNLKTTLTSMDTYYKCPYCDSDDYRELKSDELTHHERIQQHREQTLEQRVSYIEDKLNIID